MDDEKWLQRRYYGGDLPAEAERALHAVGLCWEDDAAAEAHIKHALALAPDHLATHYGAYKFYYYRRRLNDCLPHVEAWVKEGIKRNNLPQDWREVRATDANFNDFDGDPRLFLFAMRALGWLLAKMRRFEDGRALLSKVAELDPRDHMGARRLIAILDSHGEEEDDQGTEPALPVAEV